MKAQTIQIDNIFTADGEIFPFSPNDTIYGLSISGSVSLNSDTSLVRVILADYYGNEWMVCEAYPMINPNWEIDLSVVADETMYRQIINPNSIKIQIVNASLNLNSLILQNNITENLGNLQENHKNFIEDKKADSISFYITSNEMLWFANRTPLSDLSYSEKQDRYGERFNLAGWDFYTGGVYDDIPGCTGPVDNSDLVDSWDWRSRHGANDPGKGQFYYDDDPLGTGWLTSVKDQEKDQNGNYYLCDGLCYIYGPLGAIEGVANLYINYHKNYDFSEQQVLDCDGDNSNDQCEQGQSNITNNYAIETGLVSESCYPRIDSPETCNLDNIPLNERLYQLKIVDDIGVNNTSNEFIKEALIQRGPLSVLLTNYVGNSNHYVVLVGYMVLEEGGKFFQNPCYGNDSISISASSPYIGQLMWIFKNSFGTQHDYYGFSNELDENFHPYQVNYYQLPVDDILTEFDTIIPSDKDKDGYWNWGISEEFDLPDKACSSLKDSDDSENRIGPFDDHYYGIPVAPEMKVYMKRSIAKDYIINNSFFSFTSNDINSEDKITFYIENTGDAQLNLIPHEISKGKVEIIAIPGASQNFEITDYPDMKICWGPNEESTFKVSFLGEQQGELSKIKIYIDENGDIPDFEFVLVYNDCLPATELETIDEDEIWSNYELKNKDYLISQGVTVTVTGEIAMAENSDIFIQNGGELIIDGGRLTASCDGLWNGIDVWGDRRHPQLVESQGTVRVKNGGTIEYARCGIENIIWYGDMSVFTGGIFDVEEALFKDNIIGIKFWPYHNYNPGTGLPVDNFSRIKTSEFKTTQELYDLGYNPECFISMTEVEGVKILACNFNNIVEDAGLPGKGIFSIGADFIVDQFCTIPEIPCQGYTPCRFENLEYGIHAGSITSVESARIRNSEFINNLRGIYLSASVYPEVTQNIFEVRGTTSVPFNEAIYCGLYLDNCTAYQIEENFFYTYFDDQQKEDLQAVGLIVNNSGPYNNEVYNNAFEGLYTGIIAQEVNRNEEGDLGLQIKCNNLLNNIFDIAVTHNDEGINGIALDQGSYNPNIAPPAGNIFTYIDPEFNPEPDGNYFNDCENINYYYHDDANGYFIIPIRHSAEQIVNPQPVAGLIFEPDDACPSNLNGGGSGILEEKSNLIIASQKADSTQSLLNILIDGGDTEGLLSDIQSSWPEDGYELYSGLIAESPYLSDNAIIKAVDKEDVLLPGMITDVLVANPQSAKSEDIMSTVDERENPLTDDQLSDIGEGRFIISAKESLESQHASYLLTKDVTKNNIVRFFKADTISISPTDSIIDILGYQSNLTDEYWKSFEYLAKRDSLNVVSSLEVIPQTFYLTAEQENEHALYEDYINILFSPDTSCSFVLKIDSLNKINLLNIMNNSNSILKIFARNILIVNDSLDYLEPIILPQPGLKSGKVRHWPVKKQIAENFLKIYPNPAKNVVIIETKLKDEPRHAAINIIDNKGIKLKTFKIQKQSEYIVIPLTDFESGMLFCQLIIQNRIVESRKLVVVK